MIGEDHKNEQVDTAAPALPYVSDFASTGCAYAAISTCCVRALQAQTHERPEPARIARAAAVGEAAVGADTPDAAAAAVGRTCPVPLVLANSSFITVEVCKSTIHLIICSCEHLSSNAMNGNILHPSQCCG